MHAIVTAIHAALPELATQDGTGPPVSLSNISAPATLAAHALVAANASGEQRLASLRVLARVATRAALALEDGIRGDGDLGPDAAMLANAADALVVAAGGNPAPAWTALLAERPELQEAARLDLHHALYS